MELLALSIFTITYLGIIFTRMPYFSIDRPSAAFFGAVAMMLTGVISFSEAVRAIDFNTIALLLGMMIIIAVLELDGFFELIAQKTISLAKTTTQLLVIITFITGLASAFLVNDAVVLLFTPVIIAICTGAQRNPVPYLIAEILSSNAGSAMTITGNPQNMLIGIASGISYARFLFYLAPISFISMTAIVMVIRAMYPDEFRRTATLRYEGNGHSYNFSSMKTSLPIFGLVIVLFFASHRIGLAIPLIALSGASLILLFGRIRPSAVIKQVDWVLLLFFASLFVVVRGVEIHGVFEPFIELAHITAGEAGMTAVHLISLFLSQVVSNVPLVILLLPVLRGVESELLWLSLASASTLAGNATIIGAMANLIVLEAAKKEGVDIGFMEFLKPGIAATIITMLVSWGILYAYHAAGLVR